jgi:hypothetical protein
MRHYDSSSLVTASGALVGVCLNIWSLLLSAFVDGLQSRELSLDSSACPVTFEALDALFVLIPSLKPDYLLDMVRDSGYPLLYGLLR